MMKWFLITFFGPPILIWVVADDIALVALLVIWAVIYIPAAFGYWLAGKSPLAALAVLILFFGVDWSDGGTD